jgi:RNA polymerase sigma factor (TIGR02999 family)
MDAPSGTGITVLLRAWSDGDRQALEKVMPLVYQHLQATAHGYIARQGPGHQLQSAALVNETYLRLVKVKELEWQDRGHFYAICSRLMRQVLTDYARAELSLKRGGKGQQLPLEDAHGVIGGDPDEDLIVLDNLLRELSEFDEQMGKVVQYRAFMGATVQETAAALQISERTVEREWRAAKAWLAQELHQRKQ